MLSTKLSKPEYRHDGSDPIPKTFERKLRGLIAFTSLAIPFIASSKPPEIMANNSLVKMFRLGSAPP